MSDEINEQTNGFVSGMRFLFPGIKSNDENDIPETKEQREENLKQHYKTGIYNACLVNDQKKITITLDLLNDDDIKDVFIDVCGIVNDNAHECLKIIFAHAKDKLKLLENCHCFYARCIAGDLDTTKWLYGLLKEYCIKPNPSVKELSHSICHVNKSEYIPYFEEDYYYERPQSELVFVYTCAYNSIETAKWLVENFDIDIHADDEAAFRFSCYCRATETAKWLYEYCNETNRKKINIHIRDDTTFIGAICNGNVETVEFLYNLEPEYFNDICTTQSVNEKKIDSCLFMACYNLNIDVAEWLYEKAKIKGLRINDMVSQYDYDKLNRYFYVRHPYEGDIITNWLIKISQMDGNIPYIHKTNPFDQKNNQM